MSKTAEKVKITIRDNRNNIVLITTSETYAKDLADNIGDLRIWWRCFVEYDNGKVGYDYPCNHNGLSPRKVITVNGRRIYADYNFSIEGVENVYDRLKKYLDKDFYGTYQPKELAQQDKAYKAYVRETSQPINKHLQPQKVVVPDELKDE